MMEEILKYHTKFYTKFGRSKFTINRSNTRTLLICTVLLQIPIFRLSSMPKASKLVYVSLGVTGSNECANSLVYNNYDAGPDVASSVRKRSIIWP